MIQSVHGVPHHAHGSLRGPLVTLLRRRTARSRPRGAVTLSMNAQDRNDLSILMGMVTDLRHDMTSRFDAQDIRLRRLEDRGVADDAVAAAAEQAAEKSGMRMRTVVSVAAAVGSLVVGVGGLLLRVLQIA